MGLFDYVKCELPLPDEAHGTVYQTKDLDPFMDHYTIDGLGHLVEEKRGVVDYDGDICFYEADTFRATFRRGECREICKFVDGEWRQVWKPSDCAVPR